MISLESVTLPVCYFVIMLSVTIACAACVIILAIVRPNFSLQVKHVLAITALVLVTVIPSIILANNVVSEIKNSTLLEYKVELNINQNNLWDLYCLKDNKPSEKIIATLQGDDKRYYEVYLISKDNGQTASLYTRSEKGVYLPVTQAAVETQAQQ